jgi:carbamoylphosphate synthase large subunit
MAKQDVLMARGLNFMGAFRVIADHRKESQVDNVLITGVGGPAGKATARFFRDHGFRVIGTDCAEVDAAVDRFSMVPRGDDPDFANVILRLLGEERPVLFLSTVTEELPQAARMKRQVEDLGVQMFSSDPLAVTIANDKYLTALLLEACTIPVPQTLLANDIGSAFEAGKRLGYPFIGKPRFGRGGRGVVVYSSPADAVREVRRNLVFQEFLGGPEYDANLFVHPASHVALARILLKTQLREGLVGNAVAVKPVEQRDVSELAADACRALKLEGPIDMDIRYNERGQPKILDINARIGANVLFAEGIMETLLACALERSRQ